MNAFLAAVKQLGGALVLITPLSPTDPGFGNLPPVDPGFGHGHPFPDRPDAGLPGYGHPDAGLPGYGHPGNWVPGSIGGHPGNWVPGSIGGHPGNALPTPPVRPANPIVLPPGMWPPSLPPGANVPDIDLPPGPPGVARPPIVIPPDPSVGIEQPIYLPSLPEGVALLIAIPQATPKEGTPPNTKPAILVQSGKKPVLVYVSAAATPK